MPRATVEEPEFVLLPEDTLLRCRLNAVNPKEVPYRDKNTGEQKTFTKWEWEFQVIEGEFAEKKIWGETNDKLTTHPDNKPRNWAEAILGQELDLGMEFDTDDIVGLIADVTVYHHHYTKNGEDRTIAKIQDVLPAGKLSSAADPPF